MKIGVMICSFYLLPDLTLPAYSKSPTPEAAIALAAKAGLEGIELQDYRSGFFDEKFPEVLPEKRLREVKEFASSIGIEIPSISAMAGNLLEANIGTQVSYVQKWLRLASSIQTGILKINIGTKPVNMSNERAFEQAKRCLKALARSAKDYGIVLAPELWPPSYPTSDIPAMITLLKTVDSDYLRHTLDNYMLPPEWAVTAWKLLAPYAVNVHLSPPRKVDLVGISRERFRFKEFIGTLKSIGYEGYLMIEWRARNRPTTKLVEGLRKTRKLFEDQSH